MFVPHIKLIRLAALKCLGKKILRNIEVFDTISAMTWDFLAF